ncbi:TetR/AcrR family transcriptional regulator [Streptomyces sp. SID13031]|uniref:TetR/AcrR family transcriptional regulator n=1 Tax=Streptomyces sp. SID13031 TaxID=2706046 RepID=UPI0013C94F5E|nr:TetR/AcrR family transcriptional regulator [Streptomyces sp. SID13031]NEA30746.1 TetR/AcrR family transcriptional regulator [Streptomyces sp. SID13031]
MDSIWTREKAAAAARETLSREQIVRGAMVLLDSEGLAGLSMRKLAARLDAGATSLYWHVHTKDDLIDLVIDEIYAEIDVPEPELAGWRAGVTLFAHSLRATVLRHAWLPEVLYSRPRLGPNAMSVGSRAIVLFGAAGFTGRGVDYAMGAVMSYVIGSASSEVSVRTTIAKTGKTMEDWAREISELTQTAADDRAPGGQAYWTSGTDVDTIQTEAFAFGLDSLLDGLQIRVSQ